MEISKILAEMTLEDKIRLCSGADSWHTKAMQQYGIPEIMMADGPHGLRKQEDAGDMLGINRSLPATCFPTAASTACSWDVDLLEEMGSALGCEASNKGVSLVLGPGLNIKRNPLCGRNFEYFSEDPCLSGRLAAAQVRGIQSQDVGACIKHFAANSQEYKRFSSDSVMDDRTLREIYLSGFETAVKEGKPWAVMCAYNLLGGVQCSDHRTLLTDILRKQWGFDGIVVTDWGALSDRIKAFEAGCDLNMPGGSDYMEMEALEAIEKGQLDPAGLEASAGRVLKLVEKGQKALKKPAQADMEAHHRLAARIAAESAVLLKNDRQLLPLKGEDSVVFIGAMAENMRYQGTGSSRINPWKLTSVRDVCPDIPCVPGYKSQGETDEKLLREAAQAAKQADKAIVFAGLPESYESEGFDREHMNLPEGHNRLIEAVAAVNPNTIVVLFAGSPVELPWEEQVGAILYMGLPGQAGGVAARGLLFGRCNPCGKLAESWPMRYEDCVSSGFYAGNRRDAHYREGLYVGYRYYQSAGVSVRYPFGHGLSYTAFSYDNITVEGRGISCHVTNVGNMAGKEIVQLYVKAPKGAYYRPKLELKAFKKVFLEPGETKTVSFALTDRAFSLWNDGWVIPGGDYEILVGGSSENLPLKAVITLDDTGSAAPEVPGWYFDPEGKPTHEDFEGLVGHAVSEVHRKKGQFTMANTVMEMKESSLVMKLLYQGVKIYIGSGVDGPKNESNPTYRMMLLQAADASLSGMKINGGIKGYYLEGLLEMANGHFFRGIKTMLNSRKKYKK